MKIGIITLPLHINYGGCLQAYALQNTLIRLGHEAYILSVQKKDIKSRLKKIADSFTRIGKFKKKNIRTISIKELTLEECQRLHLDAIIVGSDQVWRKVYTNETYFLGFLGEDNNILRLTYAASFSVNYLEFNDKDISRYKQLLHKFKAISVREDTAIQLLSEHFDYKTACHVLDPTMLIKANTYRSFFLNKTIHRMDYIYEYLLGKGDFIDNMLQFIIEKTGYGIIKTVIGRGTIHNYINTRKGIENWLANIANAKMMITDSFHGCVFAIIFNTEFVVLENKSGGNTRIESLLRLFNITKRIVHSPEEYNSIEPINWVQVNQQLNVLQKQSIRFLTSNLK